MGILAGYSKGSRHHIGISRCHRSATPPFGRGKSRLHGDTPSTNRCLSRRRATDRSVAWAPLRGSRRHLRHSFPVSMEGRCLAKRGNRQPHRSNSGRLARAL